MGLLRTPLKLLSTAGLRISSEPAVLPPSSTAQVATPGRLLARLAKEQAHSASIQDHAERIWGWTSPAGMRRADRRAAFFTSLAGLRGGHRVLEIGCGTGVFTEKVARTGAHITATDLSVELLDKARRKNIPNCRFETADAHRLCYADDTFDCVYGSSILHHLEWHRALAEIWRTLKPGGHMVFAEPNMLNPQILVQKNVPVVKRWMGDTPDETAFVRYPFKRDLRRLGFENVEVCPYDFLHPLTPRPLIPLVDRLGRILERLPLLREIAGSLIISGTKSLRNCRVRLASPECAWKKRRSDEATSDEGWAESTPVIAAKPQSSRTSRNIGCR